MIEIRIESFTNGFSLSAYDDEDGYIVREIAETKTEILSTLLKIISDMGKAEQEKLVNSHGV